MIEVKGKYTSAIIYNDDCEDYAKAQIGQICDNEVSAGTRIIVMPDVHPGTLATIGFTMTLGNRIMPNLLGIDLGCGMTVARIRGRFDGKKLDTVIRDNVPSGFSSRSAAHRMADDFDINRLKCASAISGDKILRSLGTLGSGNHFIEVDKSEDGELYLVIHTGSRNLGKMVTEYYLNAGQKHLKSQGMDVTYHMTYLEDGLMDDYIHDVAVTCDYAEINRQIILSEICKGMKWKTDDVFSCVHNYISEATLSIGGDTVTRKILRKGAISAHAGERVIIPINMKDGVILGTGKGNAEWNCSAPHGSGRIANRENVRNSHTVSEFKSEMEGIYCSCIGKDTIDEAPFAYRRINDILANLTDTVEVTKILRPVYNFKAGGDSEER
ncbi:MAG: RtcB family protein [Lachnospiraceae bacterium]|nr:RtcB family protein [Lachnospiraceae bacterium]